MNIKTDIIPKLQTYLHHIDTSTMPKNISRIILFGSYARGEQTLYSDIDISVVYHGTQKKKRGTYFSWQEELDYLFSEAGLIVNYFYTNEHNLHTSTDTFDTNTWINKEGITLWTQTPTSQ